MSWLNSLLLRKVAQIYGNSIYDKGCTTEQREKHDIFNKLGQDNWVGHIEKGGSWPLAQIIHKTNPTQVVELNVKNKAIQFLEECIR